MYQIAGDVSGDYGLDLDISRLDDKRPLILLYTPMMQRVLETCYYAYVCIL